MSYRVVLQQIPTDAIDLANIKQVIQTALAIPLFETRIYVDALPSFVGQNLEKEVADVFASVLTELGATAVVEKE